MSGSQHAAGAREGAVEAGGASPARWPAGPPREAGHGPAARSRAARRAVEAVAERSYAGLVARLAARTGDPAAAEDALADALVAALVDWSGHGVPRSPEAWLWTVARRKWIDSDRRRRIAEEARPHLRHLAAERRPDRADLPGFPDASPALALVCTHPALDAEVRAPLVLQAAAGFDAAALATVLGVPPATLAQRLVRAKRRLRSEEPTAPDSRAEQRVRIDAVLQAAAHLGRRLLHRPSGSVSSERRTGTTVGPRRSGRSSVVLPVDPPTDASPERRAARGVLRCRSRVRSRPVSGSTGTPRKR